MSAAPSDAGWAVLGAALAVTVVVSRRAPRRVAPLGRVLTRWFPLPWWRSALLVGWMWLGWHLFAR
jgi:hypothetical protein